MDYMHRMKDLDSPKPEWLEILVHAILGVVGGCAASLPVAIKHRKFFLYVISAYAVVGGISALIGGASMYVFFYDMPQIQLRAIAFAAALGMAVPVALLIVRAIIHVHIKTPIGEVTADMDDYDETAP